jgi:sec-independent protein translocase protein TatA
LAPHGRKIMNLGTTEILLILAVVLLLFGGRKLPELAKGLGKSLRIFKDEMKNPDDKSND